MQRVWEADVAASLRRLGSGLRSSQMANKVETVEEFLARGGSMTRVADEARTMTEREIWLARHGEQRKIDERHEVLDHLGRVRVRNGLGEWIA